MTATACPIDEILYQKFDVVLHANVFHRTMKKSWPPESNAGPLKCILQSGYCPGGPRSNTLKVEHTTFADSEDGGSNLVEVRKKFSFSCKYASW